MSTSPFYRPGNPFGGSYMSGIRPGAPHYGPEIEFARANPRQFSPATAGVGPLKPNGQELRYAPNATNTWASLRQRREEGKRERNGTEVSTIQAPVGGNEPAPAPMAQPLALGAGPDYTPPAPPGTLGLPPGPFIMPPAQPTAGREPAGHTYRAAGNGPRPLNRPVTPRPFENQNVGMYDRAGLLAGLPVADQLRDRSQVVDAKSRPFPPPPSHRRRT